MMTLIGEVLADPGFAHSDLLSVAHSESLQ